jgi:hypothetical protein
VVDPDKRDPQYATDEKADHRSIDRFAIPSAVGVLQTAPYAISPATVAGIFADKWRKKTIIDFQTWRPPRCLIAKSAVVLTSDEGGHFSNQPIAFHRAARTHLGQMAKGDLVLQRPHRYCPCANSGYALRRAVLSL